MKNCFEDLTTVGNGNKKLKAMLDQELCFEDLLRSLAETNPTKYNRYAKRFEDLTTVASGSI